MSYGDLRLDPAEGQWHLTNLAPHVAIVFKRMFPRVAETATAITLTDTDEVRADERQADIHRSMEPSLFQCPFGRVLQHANSHEGQTFRRDSHARNIARTSPKFQSPRPDG